MVPVRSGCFVLAVAAVLASAGADAQARSTDCTSTAERASSPDSVHARIGYELGREIQRSAIAAGITKPVGYLVLEHDRRTGEATHHLVQGNVPAEVIAEAHRRMSARLDESPRREPVLSFGIRLDEGPRIPIDLVECRPQLLNPRVLQEGLMRVAEQAAPFGNPEIRLSLRMRVTQDGRAEDAEFERRSGFASIEAGILRRLVPRLRFAPARLNDRPVNVWVTLPMQIPARQPPPPDARAPRRP